MQISANAQAVAYLISAILFILALKGLTHPASARRGNFYGMIGMAIAIVATLLATEIHSYGFIIAGVVAGALIGAVVAARVQMTAMPQLVAALHSFVGMAAVLVAIFIAAVIYILSSLDTIVAGAIQKYGTQVTQTPVRVSSTRSRT